MLLIVPRVLVVLVSLFSFLFVAVRYVDCVRECIDNSDNSVCYYYGMGAGKGRARRARATGVAVPSASVGSLPLVPLVGEVEGKAALREMLSWGSPNPKGIIYRLNKAMGELYGEPNRDGMTRTIYFADNVVYKIPKPGSRSFPLHDCVKANLLESPLNPYLLLPMAPRELVWHRSGLPIIVMERVEVDLPVEDLPSWASSEETDEQQIGRRLSGEYVLYDAGCTSSPSDWFDELIFGDDS
jgi:hypothetical protein